MAVLSFAKTEADTVFLRDAILRIIVARASDTSSTLPISKS